MLNDTFYTITEMTGEAGLLKAMLRLRDDHPIYQGHFPGQPVVPGVCLLQIAKELAETATRKQLRLSVVSNMKFLIPLTPRETPVIRAELNYNILSDKEITISTVFFIETAPCCKLTATYHITGPLPTAG